MHNLIPLSLYIHIPWCIKKCPYCDFNSYASTHQLPEAAYIKQLMADLNQDLPFVEGRKLKSIFFGGGTPSLFSARAIGKILEETFLKIPAESNIEITLEANPGTLEREDFKNYRLAGINRISLGAQSFQVEKLKSLGRIHSNKELFLALESLHAANFDAFNIDLMYGLPNQTLPDALYDLETALSFSPPHLSWYNLTIEPNTLFYKQPPSLPKDDLIWEIYQRGLQFLQGKGFKNYEVSAFAKPGFECRHNLNYWEFGDYLGIGAGAHSKLSQITPKGLSVHRFAKTRYPKDYLEVNNGCFKASETLVSKQDLIFEFMLNALRLTDGFSNSLFEKRTGLPFDTLQDKIKEGINKNLIEIQQDMIKPTLLGKNFLNDSMSLFLS